MRRALPLLLILATALPALAATPPAPPKPKPAATVQAPIEAPSVILPAPIPLAAGRPGGDVMQCKSTCARTLIFCQSGGDDDSCGSRWAQCNASCSSSYQPPRFR